MGYCTLLRARAEKPTKSNLWHPRQQYCAIVRYFVQAVALSSRRSSSGGSGEVLRTITHERMWQEGYNFVFQNPAGMPVLHECMQGPFLEGNSHKCPCPHQLIVIAGMTYLPWLFDGSLVVVTVVVLFVAWAIFVAAQCCYCFFWPWLEGAYSIP